VAATEADPPRRVLRITARSAVIGVGVVVVGIVGARVFVAAHRPLSWFAAAVVVAVLIDPIVDVLDRHLPRLVAVLIALLVLGMATWGVIYVAFDNLSRGVERAGEAAKEAVADVEKRDDSLGQRARDIEATRRVDEFVDTLDQRVTGGGDVLRSTAGTAPTYFLGAILTLFLMSYGPRLARSAVEQLPDARARDEVTGITVQAIRRSRRAVLLTVAEGVAVGLVVAMVAAMFDLPATAAIGVAAGVMALLPHVGIVLGTLPLVLLVLALHSDGVAVVTLVVVLACQLVDSYWLRPKISARSVHIGLLVPWTVALVGYAVYGVGGAVFSVIFAVFALAVLDELGARTNRDEPHPTQRVPAEHDA
jgi:predicted PurR-regulated permease PerM